MWGPPGTGKTYSALETSRVLNAPIFKLSITDSLTPEELFFSWAAADGRLSQAETPLTRGLIASNQGVVVILMDEIDKSRPRVEDLILPLLEDDNIEISGRVIRYRPENIVFVMTSNNRRALREETLRRFNIVKFVGYSDELDKKVFQQAGCPYLPVVQKILRALRGADPHRAPSAIEMVGVINLIRRGFPDEVVYGKLFKELLPPQELKKKIVAVLGFCPVRAIKSELKKLS